MSICIYFHRKQCTLHSVQMQFSLVYFYCMCLLQLLYYVHSIYVIRDQIKVIRLN